MGICSETQSPQESGSAPTAQRATKVIEPIKLKVYGHHFDSDTRTVLTLLDISGIDYEFKEVDIFKGEHRDVKYLAMNPQGSIPMIIDQDC